MSRKIFLLDSNVLVDFYMGQPKVTEVIRKLREERKFGKCLMFIPNYCIGEALCAFAKKCHYEDEITEEKFKKIKWDFINEVSRDYEFKREQQYSHIELNRYHLFNAHLVYQPAWEFMRTNQFRYKKPDNYPKIPYATDLLVIAQGIEMTHMYSEREFAILTSDQLLIDICEHLQTLDEKARMKFVKKDNEDEAKTEGSNNLSFKYLTSFRYPNALNARDYKKIMEFMKQ